MTGAKEKHPPFVVVLRGPAGAGKTTLAKAVQEAAPGRAAVIDTDLFRWEIVPGEPDKRLVYHNVLLLAHNYLRHGYGVVLPGLILTREETGAMEELRGFARAHDAPFLDFYCHAPLEVVLERSRARRVEVPEASIVEWWHLALADRENVERWDLTELDMRERPAALARRILRMLVEHSGFTP